MSYGLNELNINEYGHFDNLKSTVNKTKAKEYFEKQEGVKLSPPKVNMKVHKLLQKFIISGGYSI